MIFRSMDEVIDDSSASSPPSFVSSATSTSDFFLHKITLQQAYRKKKQPVLSKPKRFISHDHGVEDAGSSTTTDKGAVNIVDSAAAASVEVQLQNDQQQQRQQHQQKKNISSVNIAATMSGGSSCCDASLLSVKVKVLETLVSNVFTSIASLRSAYGLMQSTISIAGSSPAAAADHHHHHHLESASFSSANRSIVAELARLTRLQHSYLERNAIVSGGSSSDGIRIEEDGRSRVGMVSPSEKALLKSYEGVIENLHAEVRKKKAEVESLKDWLAKSTLVREKLEKKVRRLEEDEKARALKEESVGVGVGGYNKMEMEAEIRGAVERAAEACRSFTKLLMSLMRAADLGLWDIIDLDGEGEWGNWRIAEQQKQQQQRRRRRLYLYSEAARKQKSSREEEAEEEEEWALESYVSRRMWRGFESADFYVEDAISSEVIEAAAAAAEAGGGGGWEEGYRRRCREEYERMKVVEAAELVGGGGDRRRKFGKFCLTKFGEIMNAKIERRILGNSEHSEQIRQGSHPNSKVYQSFLGLAKGVWLVHRLAFSFFPSPPPSIFQARPSMPFSPLFMQPFPSSSPPSPPPYFVAFPITPGFLISSRIIVKCKVRLLPRLPTST